MVVSDTSPLDYLVLIGQINVLPALYGRVLIPQSVYEELGAPLEHKVYCHRCT
jgi:predicted nucleic acid-binding protein